MSIISSTVTGSNKAVAEIRGFFGSSGFKNAVGTARRISNRISSGALQRGWKSSAWRAGGFAAAGGAAGYASSDYGDRMGGTLRGAAMGAAGFGAYRVGRGLYGSGMIGEARAGIRSGTAGLSGMWDRTVAGASAVNAWEQAGSSRIGGGFGMMRGYGSSWAPGAAGPASRLKYGMSGGKVVAKAY